MLINVFIGDRIGTLREKIIELNQISLENISKKYISRELKAKEKEFNYLYSSLERVDLKSETQINSYLGEVVKDNKSENIFLMNENMLLYGQREDTQIDEKSLKRLQSEGEKEKAGYFIEGEWYIFYNPVDVDGWQLVKIVKKNEIEKEIDFYIRLAEMFFRFEIILVVMGIIFIVYKMKGSHGIEPLTGLKKRELFDGILLKSNKMKEDYSIIFFDVDNFKEINDTYGHQVGDIVLKRVGKVVKKLMSPQDEAYRYGGDEFVVYSIRSRMDTYTLGEEIRKQVESLKWREGFHITISIGIGVSKDDDSSEVLKRAEKFLYKSKNLGRNMVSFEK